MTTGGARRNTDLPAAGIPWQDVGKSAKGGKTVDQQWCSTTEAATRIGCDSQTVINYIRAGVLLAAQDRQRGRWRVWVASVDRLIAERGRQIGARLPAIEPA